MIIVITYKDEEEGRYPMVSHGYDVATNKLVILPQVPVWQIGAKFDHDVGEWTLI